jgi:8-hydroxy-5-deazaflavin:NADPH oxidoreductase
MRYGVLGTGMVGEALATRLTERGHDVMMGSRTADNKEADAGWRRIGARARVGTFRDAAAFGEILFDCTQGAVCPDVSFRRANGSRRQGAHRRGQFRLTCRVARLR